MKNKKNISSSIVWFALCVVIQVLPIFYVVPMEFYSKEEIGVRVEECHNEYEKKIRNEYEEVLSSGEKVENNIEDIIKNSMASIEKFCNSRVLLSLSKYDYNSILYIVLLYVVPSSFLLSRPELYQKYWHNSLRNKRIVRILVGALIVLFGCVLIWDFGLTNVVHEKVFGKILF